MTPSAHQPDARVPPVRLTFSPDPAYVRTVRMVALAVARRAGVADGLLDEVRLAIGEACTRAVKVHRRDGCTDPIEVTMSDGSSDRGRSGGDRGRGARFTVRVTDRGSAEAARKEQAGGTGEIVARATVAPSGDDTGRNVLDEEALTIGVGLALLAGLVADFAVLDAPDGAGTEVRMSWPVGAAGGAGKERRGG
jgi:anti-sigma regulatory factor (Ser/Thr protein kinase)